MPRSRRPVALVPVPSDSSISARLTLAATVLLAPLASIALAASTAAAQGPAASDTPLHLAASRFEFLASDIPQPLARPLRVHNGGATRFTDVRVVRLAYADSARGAAWLVALPRQSAVAPDELATVGTLCVDATGLAAGTYHATAAVVAREVADPVAFTVTLVVTDAGARARHAAARCTTAAEK